MRKTQFTTFALLAACTGGGTGSIEQDSAVFTTTADGNAVDANIYGAKGDVYLDGGPGNHAPAHAAALDPGDYYFQVTDPAGKVLLSSDDVACRQFTIGADGFITAVGGGACAHATGTDSDHGALTVQLMPFDDTPNNGGEYKAWVIGVDHYDANAKHDFGFVHRYSKTDNFKVLVSGGENPPPPPPPTCCCGDGVINGGEQCDDGNTHNGDGCSATCQLEQVP